jgi:hypothetical protein
MYKTFVLALFLLYTGPAGAVLYTCTEGGKTVFRSTPCPPAETTKDVVQAPREAPRPRVVQRPASSQPSGYGGVCAASSDCAKGYTCRVLERRTTGACYPSK